MKNIHSIFIITILLSVLTSCNNESKNAGENIKFPEFLKVGHRGARGLMPENTIPSMKQAINDGANFLEVDVQISKDYKVIVYHDPYLNRKFTLLPNGEEIPEEDSRRYIIHQMEYSSIRNFDVGSKFHSEFPDQQKIKSFIPLLKELIDSVENYTAENNLPPMNYNIEIKANPEKDGEFQPEPEEYIALVMEVLNSASIGNRFYIQSFDVRQLKEVRKQYPEIIIGFLTGNKENTFEENIEGIGFYPDIYSPNYKLASEEIIAQSHENNMKFVPWTVNSEKEVKRLIEMGVDGIITDFPNLLN